MEKVKFRSEKKFKEVLLSLMVLLYYYNALDEEWAGISEDAKEFISLMLSPENKRPSAQECLKDKWFSV